MVSRRLLGCLGQVRPQTKGPRLPDRRALVVLYHGHGVAGSDRPAGTVCTADASEDAVTDAGPHGCPDGPSARDWPVYAVGKLATSEL